MFKPIKSVNSKAFLLLYLAITLIILVLWVSRMEISQPDRRDIPDELRPFLISPPKTLPQFVLNSQSNQILTNVSFDGRWSFIYFTHSHCQPECDVVIDVMQNLKRLFAGPTVQFLLINFDNQGESSALPKSSLQLYSGSADVIHSVIRSFDFLYLEPESYQNSNKVEQQHYIYLVDPQGRVYAVFKPPFTSLAIQHVFFRLRDFYARSE
ncbi:MAG: photosynthetic protein synthase I [Methylophaga sp.]|nr:photosynthetic protein synthase I [Methylophaga sp.]|tara:strand:- start:60 stop:689 length:630 start_codon:yes stop_codon:yes gene_type:complete